MATQTTYTTVDSPLGEVLIAAGPAGLTAIELLAGVGAQGPDPAWTRGLSPLLARAEQQLSDYFAGRRQQFDLPLAPTGTPFQCRVWQALRAIPYGETTSYGALAQQLGLPTAARAVGAANGRNPLPIVVPCHRVVGHDGRLTGFRGGLPLKRALLELEARPASDRS